MSKQKEVLDEEFTQLINYIDQSNDAIPDIVDYFQGKKIDPGTAVVILLLAAAWVHRAHHRKSAETNEALKDIFDWALETERMNINNTDYAETLN